MGVLIGSERGRANINTYLGGREQDEFFLSVITASELLHGVHRAVDADVCGRRAAFVEAVLERFPLLPVDVTVARARTMVTGNVRESTRVPGPDVGAWTEETTDRAARPQEG